MKPAVGVPVASLGVEPNLTAIQCRVLGSLLEKEVSVPSTYPMTLKAVVSACNQTTGRDPVMALDERTVQTALDELRAMGLVRLVHPSHGARATKYRQVADEVLGLSPDERAVVTLLLLRGDQTPGELRSRAERLHEFGAIEEVGAALERLSGRDVPIVVERARRPGQKEVRWGHLLASGSEPSGSPSEDGSGGAAGGSGSSPDSHLAPTSSGPPTPQPTPGSGSSSAGSAAVSPGPEHALLASLVGTWRGGGEGVYPTIASFSYVEEIVVVPVPGKPVLGYTSRTRTAPDGAPMHAESGWFRIVAPGEVELVVAQAPGIVEVVEGPAEVFGGTGPASGVAVVMASTLVGGSTTSVEVTATERRYRVEGDTLTYEVAMAGAGQPLTGHLRAELHRS